MRKLRRVHQNERKPMHGQKSQTLIRDPDLAIDFARQREVLSTLAAE